MALVLADRVQETSTSPGGTGTLNLSGTAPAGFKTFSSGIGTGNSTYYCIFDTTAYDWEVGIGTYTSGSPGTLSRTTVLSNSAGTTSAINFTNGNTLNIFVTYPSEKSVNLDSSGNVSALGTISSGTWQGTTVGVAYGGTGVTASSGANSVVLRDANQNIAVNSVTQNLTKTTSAAGTTTLTLASSHFQILTGTTTQTYKLPDATSLPVGTIYVFDNDSTGNLTVQDNALGTVDVVAPGGYSTVFLEANGTVAGEWGRFGMIPNEVNWGTNSLALGGSTIVSGGTWQGNPIAYNYGGTGLTTFTAANYALYSTSASALTAGTLPVAAGGTGATTLTANGVVYGNGTSAAGVTAAGTTGQVLVGNTGAAPSWATVSSSLVSSFSAGTTGFTPSTATTGAITLAGTLNVANGGTGLTSLTAGYIPFGAGTSAFGSNANLFWDNTNGRLGIGTSSPTQALDVNGSSRFYGASPEVKINRGSGNQPKLSFGSTTQTDFYVEANSASGIMRYDAGASAAWGGVHAFYTDTSERMRITSTGNVGIGTSSPNYGGWNKALSVIGSTNAGVEAGSSQTTADATVGGFDVIQTSNTTNKEIAQIAGASTGATAGNTGGYLKFYTKPDAGSIAERMRLDSSGNLGLGVTPSAWESTAKAIQFGSLGYVSRGSSGQTMLGYNNYVNTSNQYIYLATTQASRYEQISGEHRWFNAASGTAGNAITFTQAMTLDASGRLGIGTSSPATKLNIKNSSGNTTFRIDNSTTTFDMAVFGDNTCALEAGNSQPMLFFTAGSERMRIDSSGNVGIGTSSPTNFTNSKVLEVAGGTNTGAVLASSNSGTVIAEMQGNNGDGLVYYGSRTNHPVVFRANGIERLRIGTSGQLGIGGANYGTSGQVLTSNGSGSAPSWQTVSGGQYFGTATTKAIAYNSNTISENITVTAGNNGLSAGGITISTGYTVTVETGANWVIV